jgi:hypothetical protein
MAKAKQLEHCEPIGAGQERESVIRAGDVHYSASSFSRGRVERLLR